MFVTTSKLNRREELSQALSGEGMAVLPSQNVFAVENYHKGSASQNPGEGDRHALLCSSLVCSGTGKAGSGGR